MHIQCLATHPHGDRWTGSFLNLFFLCHALGGLNSCKNETQNNIRTRIQSLATATTFLRSLECTRHATGRLFTVAFRSETNSVLVRCNVSVLVSVCFQPFEVTRALPANKSAKPWDNSLQRTWEKWKALCQARVQEAFLPFYYSPLRPRVVRTEGLYLKTALNKWCARRFHRVSISK